MTSSVWPATRRTTPAGGLAVSDWKLCTDLIFDLAVELASKHVARRLSSAVA